MCTFHHPLTLISPFVHTFLDSAISPSYILQKYVHIFWHVLSEHLYIDIAPGFFFELFSHPYIVGHITVLFCLTGLHQFTIYLVFLSLTYFQNPLLTSFHFIVTQPLATCLLISLSLVYLHLNSCIHTKKIIFFSYSNFQ